MGELLRRPEQLMRVLVLCGSLRAGSYNRRLALLARDVAPEGVELELYEGLGALPLYDQDLDRESVDEPASVADLRRRISEADALLLVTPEHNGSVSAALKNAIDWVSARHRGSWLRGKTVAIAGATTGRYGAIWAQQDLRRILGLAGARVVGPELPVAQAQEAFDETGACLDPRLTERVRGHLDLLVAEARGEGLPDDRLPTAA